MTALQVAEKSKIKCAGGFAVKAISNIQAITSPEVTLLPSKNNSDQWKTEILFCRFCQEGQSTFCDIINIFHLSFHGCR